MTTPRTTRTRQTEHSASSESYRLIELDLHLSRSFGSVFSFSKPSLHPGEGIATVIVGTHKPRRGYFARESSKVFELRRLDLSATCRVLLIPVGSCYLIVLLRFSRHKRPHSDVPPFPFEQPLRFHTVPIDPEESERLERVCMT